MRGPRAESLAAQFDGLALQQERSAAGQFAEKPPGVRSLRVQLADDGRRRAVVEEIGQAQRRRRCPTLAIARSGGCRVSVAPPARTVNGSRRSRPSRRAACVCTPDVKQRLDEAQAEPSSPGGSAASSFDEAVVDAQAGQGGQDVLDQRHLHRQAAQRGAPLRAGHLADVGRDARPARQVGAHENDPGGRRGRQETKPDVWPRSGSRRRGTSLGRTIVR